MTDSIILRSIGFSIESEKKIESFSLEISSIDVFHYRIYFYYYFVGDFNKNNNYVLDYLQRGF